MKKIDLVGFKFGRLTVISEVVPNNHRNTKWNCRCDCGSIVAVIGYNLRGSHTKSCGCLGKELTSLRMTLHGHTANRGMSSEYLAWRSMRDRCINPKADSYRFYGQKGITVCERWMKFENFLADMGIKPKPKLTIDRIDSRGNYEPSNCKWSTMREQQNNKTNNRRLEFNGTSQTVTEWARHVGLMPTTLLARLRKGWSIERAIMQPLRGSSLPRGV